MAALVLRADGLTYREIGVVLGRSDGNGPLGREGARSLAMKALRQLNHHSRRDHWLQPAVQIVEKG